MNGILFLCTKVKRVDLQTIVKIVHLFEGDTEDHATYLGKLAYEEPITVPIQAYLDMLTSLALFTVGLMAG